MAQMLLSRLAGPSLLPAPRWSCLSCFTPCAVSSYSSGASTPTTGIARPVTAVVTGLSVSHTPGRSDNVFVQCTGQITLLSDSNVEFLQKVFFLRGDTQGYYGFSIADNRVEAVLETRADFVTSENVGMDSLSNIHAVRRIIAKCIRKHYSRVSDVLFKL